MLNWIRNWLAQHVGSIAKEIIHVVWGVIHAITSIVQTVFGNVGKAWHDLYSAVDELGAILRNLALNVWRIADRVIVHDIPAVYRWAERRAAGIERKVEHGLADVRHDADTLARKAERDIDRVTAWVRRDVLGPLRRDYDRLAADVRKYAAVAAGVLTDPRKLALAVIDALGHLAASDVESAARTLGPVVLHALTADPAELGRVAEDFLSSIL